MSKASWIFKRVFVLSLTVVILAACGKVDPLTEGGSTDPNQGAVATAAPTASPAPAATPVAVESPCSKVVQTSAADSSKAAVNSWASPPAMSIDVNKTYCAAFKTNQGSFVLEMFAKDAPNTVNNFVFLAKNNYYNGVIFHRVLETFMIQGGDPTGTGSGGPGYDFADELNSPHQYEPGIVAMANAGPNTNGSQFFIGTGEDSRNLNQMPDYTIFGKVAAGMDKVLKIAAVPTEMGGDNALSSPIDKVIIESIEIVEL